MDDDSMDGDYDLEYSDDSGSEPNADLENQYYLAKGLKAENDFAGALETFQSLLDREETKGDWGFKALKQMVKVSHRMGDTEKTVQYYRRLLTYVKYITKNYAEKSINSILDYVSSSQQPDLLMALYEITLDCLRESHNDRLWFKTNAKLAHLYLAQKDWIKFDRVLAELKSSCKTETGEEDDRKGTQLLEVYALEIQKYTEEKNNRMLHRLYDHALNVKSAIPHPLIMGTIKECGGKMYLRNGAYADAHKAFLEAFKSYDESGSSRRIQCLKYLVLAAMLQNSKINPFESQETKAFRNEPGIAVMDKLVQAYQQDDLAEFSRIIVAHEDQIKSDDFINEYISELLTNIRRTVLRQVIKPYTSVSLGHAARLLQVSVIEVTRLLTQIILDEPQSLYHIDQTAGMLYSKRAPKPDDMTREALLDSLIASLETMKSSIPVL